MDYSKTVVPSQLLLERGSNLVVINPGSVNIRVGLAKQDSPFNIPNCIARRIPQFSKLNVQDQLLNSQLTTEQHMEREKAYEVIASLLRIPFLDEEFANNSVPRKMGRVNGYNPQNTRKNGIFTWSDINEKDVSSSVAPGTELKEPPLTEHKFREVVCGEEALRISPSEPYCLRRHIRRGHLNILQYYPMQRVLEDLHAMLDWILLEKLYIPLQERSLYSAILVVPEAFDNREIKDILSILLQDLRFSSAVVHQEGLAEVFGNGLSTACVVNMGAQVTSVICIEDISRCLLWTQRHHQTWPQIRTDVLTKRIDLLMLNRLKESYCEIKEGELDAVAVVHSYENAMPAGSHKTRLTALNVPSMGLFYPKLLIADLYPPPPFSWFHDYEDMLEETWHVEFPRSSDMSDGPYPGVNVGLQMWDNYPFFPMKPKKEEKVGLAEAIASSILSSVRIDLQRKLFCSIQLIGGVALTGGLIPAVEERVLHAIPSNEAIDTVEILGVLDFGRDAWVHREDWIRNGIHIGSGRKYKDSYFLQAQAMCYINS